MTLLANMTARFELPMLPITYEQFSISISPCTRSSPLSCDRDLVKLQQNPSLRHVDASDVTVATFPTPIRLISSGNQCPRAGATIDFRLKITRYQCSRADNPSECMATPSDVHQALQEEDRTGYNIRLSMAVLYDKARNHQHVQVTGSPNSNASQEYRGSYLPCLSATKTTSASSRP